MISRIGERARGFPHLHEEQPARGFDGFSPKPAAARRGSGWEGSTCFAYPTPPFPGSLRLTSGREEDGKILEAAHVLIPKFKE